MGVTKGENMKTLNFIDKSNWPDGPWKNEPDKVTWIDEETGLDCMARRAPSVGAWCGYVGIKEGHPLYGKNYVGCTEDDIVVHGGITYSAYCQEEEKETGICHITKDDDKIYWIGFDCAHFNDMSPLMPAMPFFSDITYKDLEYVKNECKELARQLKEIENAR